MKVVEAGRCDCWGMRLQDHSAGRGLAITSTAGLPSAPFPVVTASLPPPLLFSAHALAPLHWAPPRSLCPHHSAQQGPARAC